MSSRAKLQDTGSHWQGLKTHFGRPSSEKGKELPMGASKRGKRVHALKEPQSLRVPFKESEGGRSALHNLRFRCEGEHTRHRGPEPRHS